MSTIEIIRIVLATIILMAAIPGFVISVKLAYKSFKDLF